MLPDDAAAPAALLTPFVPNKDDLFGRMLPRLGAGEVCCCWNCVLDSVMFRLLLLFKLLFVVVDVFVVVMLLVEL